MLRTTPLLRAATLGLLLGAAGCSDEELFRPASLIPVNALFTVYVAMGNSITAGFQSGGINDSTQAQAYPVLLARQMQTPFFAPLMNKPGCAPPFTNIFTNARLGGGTGSTCALRETQSVTPPFLNNVAVPGAEVIDAISNLSPSSNANALTTFFLGGMTQTHAMLQAAPTFVSVWLGNNDVLGAALAQDTTKITPVAAFTASYSAVLDSIAAAGAKAVLIGLGEGSFPPYFSLGSTYYAIKAGLVPGVAFPPAFTVSPSCAPKRGDTVFVAFPVGAALIQAAAGGTPTTLDCSNAAQTLQPAVVLALNRAVVTFNTFIAQQAASHNWAYTDFNTQYDSLRALGQVAAFPNLGFPCSTSPFGTAFSCDGIHPSASSSQLMARKLVQVINTTYGTSIPAIP
jgi:lysophospholipase L1-like esterase